VRHLHNQPKTGDGGRVEPRRGWCRALACAAVALTACVQLWAQSGALTVERRGDRLHLSAPQFHFLEGKPLERLHDGGSVTYVLSVTLQAERGGPGRVRLAQTVVFSYDLWEERYSVVQATPPNRSASHLTAAAAEAWCLDLFALAVPAAPPAKTFVVKLECSLPDEDIQPGGVSPGSTLGTLIDVFSRKARAAPPHWEAVSRPWHLADLTDKTR
jgi:hypothetical protein